MLDYSLFMFYLHSGSRKPNMPIWLINIVTHIGFKVTSIILALLLVGLGAFTVYRGIANKNYNKGYNQALIDHPQNIYNGPTVVNQQGRKMGCFPFKIGHFGFGVCHE